MPFNRYELFIDGVKCGDVSSLAKCWDHISAAYGQLDDSYSGVVSWRIEDPFVGKRFAVFDDMPGGIWEACCEDPNAFRMYLDLCGWEACSDTDAN
jgi:hypothetical protein